MTALRRYAPFYIAVLCGLVMLGLALSFWPHLAVQSSANAFFVVYLLLELRKFPKLTSGFLRKHAASTDEPTWIIVAVTFVAVLVTIGSLFILINKGGQPHALELVLSLSAVALGWFSIHTMAALHYAHLYWRPEDRRREMGSSHDEHNRSDDADEHGGLEFPGTDEPNGYDFLYYSMVIGMTAQTADVNVTKTNMRELTLIHAVASFFFNTVLVAAAVNVAVSLTAS
jgi:uncharacterized membrane protein